MNLLVKATLCTVVGAVVGSFAGLLIGYLAGAAYVDLFNVSSFEGYSSYVMFYGFILPGIPIGGFLGGLLGGLLAFKGRPSWLRRNWSQEANQAD